MYTTWTKMISVSKYNQISGIYNKEDTNTAEPCYPKPQTSGATILPNRYKRRGGGGGKGNEMILILCKCWNNYVYTCMYLKAHKAQSRKHVTMTLHVCFISFGSEFQYSEDFIILPNSISEGFGLTRFNSNLKYSYIL